MVDQTEKILIDKIFDKIPIGVDSIEYLMKVLDLSRKSVYRRKKGELPFTFEEIVILSRELDFSIDELVAKSDDSQAIFTHKTDLLFDSRETFRLMLSKYLAFYKKGIKAKSFEGIFTLNRILPIYVLDSTYLFKFFYYMWMHQGYDVPSNFRFSALVFPPDILALNRKVWEYAKFVPITTIIMDELSFKNIYMEFEYYYQRELITRDEFVQLKDELLSYITKFETIVSSGTNDYGSIYNVYLSKLNIESNSSYLKIDDDIESSFWVFGANPIYTSNSTVFTSHKKWIDSLKKYSILISQSNELLQSIFFNEQHRFVIESSQKLLA